MVALELVWNSLEAATVVVVEVFDCRDLVEEMDLVEGMGR